MAHKGKAPMRGLAVFLILCPTLVLAEAWVQLTTDDAIREALTGRTVRFDAYTIQHFNTAGQTRFVTERAADGLWEVRSGQYCSSWPPSVVWTCYDFAVNGDAVRFIGATGSVSEGRIVE